MDKTVTRRRFSASVAKGSALLAGLLTSSEAAETQVVWSQADWHVAEFREMLAASGEVKQVFDITSPVNSLDKVKNSLNGLQVGFGMQASSIRTVVGLHGPANFLNFGDAVWTRYPIGEVFGIRRADGKGAATTNRYYASSFPAGTLTGVPSDLASAWHDVSMEGLKRRGVRFLGCHTALEFQVRELKEKASLAADPEEIVRDMLRCLQPGSLMVASMVSAFALLQCKGHYAYLKV